MDGDTVAEALLGQMDADSAASGLQLQTVLENLRRIRQPSPPTVLDAAPAGATYAAAAAAVPAAHGPGMHAALWLQEHALAAAAVPQSGAAAAPAPTAVGAGGTGGEGSYLSTFWWKDGQCPCCCKDGHPILDCCIPVAEPGVPKRRP